jgi:glycosyltransferase involved in cell wall biosynthesis
MRILWVNTNFMHPTNKGGSIRTLEMLRHLHRWHEIHFVAIEDPAHPEGPARSAEYSTRSYASKHAVPARGSLAFYGQVASAWLSPLPLAMSRYRSPALGKTLQALLKEGAFDRAVVDHLTPATYYPDLPRALLFQHNVETVIWRRYAEQASNPVSRLYFKLQADRMFRFERDVCRAAGHIVAVSATDASRMRELFGTDRVSEIPTGVNLEYYTPPSGTPERRADIVFVGSMDWMANQDGVAYFLDEVLPRIHERRPATTFAIVGRNPGRDLLERAQKDPRITVTGTVPDVRPFLWGAGVSIVPLRIGGGTRLKVYESMGARVPLVSTTIGAEGLEYEPGVHLHVADSSAAFADRCLDVLADSGAAAAMAATAWQLVAERFSWETVAKRFDRILTEETPSASAP